MRRLSLLFGIFLFAGFCPAATPAENSLNNYFAAETKKIEDNCLNGIKTLDDWTELKPKLRAQLFEMLSLSPLPEKSNLKAVITGKFETNDFTVENLHFQSLPGLYCTANFYLPKNHSKPLPTILYVCGHADVKTNGLVYGNKTFYQHHGEWFARNGYACLVLDTIQLGEITGIHHGTYREGMWWWNSRGYTPAGVEAWNCIRALDYLESRPEVDKTKFGVTGRSGGGAYSWWIAALDERIKVAAPVAGITDLHNHVVDGTVEGHCDCMFFVNTYRWDYPTVAALVAPRPLLICNSDKDTIFPLDGVYRLREKVAKIYELHKASKNLGLLITEGPHSDTQDLQLPVFRWFNRHLKGEDPVIEMAATRLVEVQKLKVFKEIPSDERTSKIHETFVPIGKEPKISNAEEWRDYRESTMAQLRKKVFAGWPEGRREPIGVKTVGQGTSGKQTMTIYEFQSQQNVPLRLYVLAPSRGGRTRLVLKVLDDVQWPKFVEKYSALAPDDFKAELRSMNAREPKPLQNLEESPDTTVFFAPRGIGATAAWKDEKKKIQVRRRYMLLGQTLDGMRVWDIQLALEALRAFQNLSRADVELHASGPMAVNALYASLFSPIDHSLQLTALPSSHREGPDYLNVLRFTDIPEVLAMALDQHDIILESTKATDWEFPNRLAEKLKFDHRLEFK